MQLSQTYTERRRVGGKQVLLTIPFRGQEEMIFILRI